MYPSSEKKFPNRQNFALIHAKADLGSQRQLSHNKVKCQCTQGAFLKNGWIDNGY